MQPTSLLILSALCRLHTCLQTVEENDTGKWVWRHAEQLRGAWTLANVLPNGVCLMATIVYVSGVMHQEGRFALLTGQGGLSFANTGNTKMGTLAQAVHQQKLQFDCTKVHSGCHVNKAEAKEK